MIDSLTTRTHTIPGDFTGTQKAQNLEQAAEQFEALFLRSMLSQMRKASDVLSEGDNPFSSKQQTMMRDFYDDKLASLLASQRSSGIASLIIKQLGPQTEGMDRALKLTGQQVALPVKEKELTPPMTRSEQGS
ncbi:FlgJ family peptidoglycan hydrolase [Buttiauxella noackiae ATCC 51607]|uniref:FlgJ family peptidoglycan hydrolase n=1 Tax=Buttiauxella noackiae ATCC 51607 TaxID=1354255 RepID=A0A1B7HM27_9ENTR|nr:FlgJ family peptidoglycan hydrolase [Buttiauxella noackiae ATCC 51607]